MAISDNKLKFYFRNTPPNRHTKTGDTNFRDEFVANFDVRRGTIENLLPERAHLTGNMHNVIEATYNIPVAEYDDYFEAYISALNTAFEKHVIDRPQLVAELDDVYSETLETFR